MKFMYMFDYIFEEFTPSEFWCEFEKRWLKHVKKILDKKR